MGEQVMTPQEKAHAIALIVGLPMLAVMILFREPRSSVKTNRTHTGKIARQRVRKTNHNRKDSK
jgi:hypothetical protein